MSFRNGLLGIIGLIGLGVSGCQPTSGIVYEKVHVPKKVNSANMAPAGKPVTVKTINPESFLIRVENGVKGTDSYRIWTHSVNKEIYDNVEIGDLY